MIHFTHVTKSYEDNWKALNNVTFRINKGEFVFLTGHSGAGKSTVLKLIYMDERPDMERGGQVMVKFTSDCIYDSKSSPDNRIQAFRRKMGIIFQDFQLLHDRSVEKNLDFVLKATGWKKSERAQRIVEVLEAVGLADKAGKMPHELSGGEQQRIAIARSLLNRPKIIVADEPTGNLDPETASNIIALLRQISLTGTAVVMSTHNIPMLDKYPGIVYRCSETSINDITNTYNSIDLTAEKEES
jgi:cell division transport system ATP-binding protein